MTTDVFERTDSMSTESLLILAKMRINVIDIKLLNLQDEITELKTEKMLLREELEK